MLTQFTTFDEVRAVLGVADEELEDETLSQPLYERQLVLDLEDIALALPDQFHIVSAIQYPNRSSTQKRFFDLVQLFSAYAIGKHLLTSLPYFGELRMEDGRSQKERVRDPYQLTREGVLAGFNSVRLRLEAAYAGLVGGTAAGRATRSYLLSTGLATDPVTNQ